jgi:uncharacterized protein
MTVESLRNRSLKHLAAMARKHGVNGWHSMRKDQLVRALLKATLKSGSHKHVIKEPALVRRGSSVSGRNQSTARRDGSRGTTTRAKGDPRLARKIEESKIRLLRAKILATSSADGKATNVKDRLVTMVRGPYWLHAYWELTPAGIVRAQSALGELWHAAKPVLRLLLVSSSGSSTAAERVVRDIAIHGGVTNWYIDVNNPPQTYRLEIGYLASNGRFYCLARSNTVSTPASAADEKVDNHWSEVVQDCDKIYAMSGGYSSEVNATELQEVLEERLHRPVGTSMSNRYGNGAEYLVMRERAVPFKVDAEMVIHGVTHPDAQVTLQGTPIKLRPDGTFSVRLELPNRRQVIPLVASTRDGASQRTVVVAVERNTKQMEPVLREPSE